MTTVTDQTDFDYDYLIVGSGFGGSVSAHRLTEKGYTVAVMEMGQRWRPEDFPKTNWNLRRWIWRPGLKLFGFFTMRPFRHVLIACGNAVGGGSITYANTLLTPPDRVWDQGSWVGLADWKREMPAFYEQAERMLGVTENKLFGPADDLIRQMGEAASVGHTYKPTRVATFFPPEGETGGKTYPDPYFGGEGPDRSTCVGCGGCVMGCRYNAKNTLDKNYLYFAEKQGAEVFEQTRVVDVRPLNGSEDGRDGYEIATERSTAWFRKNRRRFTARNVVFAASSLGTIDLLFKLKQRGSLPNISDKLGDEVRTNAESIVGIRFPGKDVDVSQGVAIGSSIQLDEYTHIEVVRFPKGSDVWGLGVVPMVGGEPGWNRIFLWLRKIFRQPLAFLRTLNPFGFARQTLILLCMQTLDSSLSMRLKRPWYWPFSKLLCSEGDPIPAHIPQATAFTEKMAERFGGTPVATLLEILFSTPLTAHCMGGCMMGKNPDRGVIDTQNRVFNYKNLYVVDGSVLSANLGVNPSLTITALAERAMSHIPPKAVPAREGHGEQ